MGFFNSYPAVEVGMASGMPKVGASLLRCIAGGFSMNPQEGQYDFSRFLQTTVLKQPLREVALP